MDKNNVPDYSALLSVGKQLGQLLSNDTLVIVESTVEPGFIKIDLISMIENSDRKLIAEKILQLEFVLKQLILVK